jgi:uronate dehydrogenase
MLTSFYVVQLPNTLQQREYPFATFCPSLCLLGLQRRGHLSISYYLELSRTTLWTRWGDLQGEETFMRVLFIGASGLVGRQVIPLLKEHVNLSLAAIGGGAVSGLPVANVDITDWEQVAELVQSGTATGAPFDAVVNCAIADYKGIDKSKPNGKRQYHNSCIDVNVRGAYHVYEAAAKAGVPRVVYISSMTAVLGPPRYDFIDESCHDRPHGLYAASKVFGEHVGRSYAYRKDEDSTPMSVVCLRLGHPYPAFSASDDLWLTSQHRRSVATHTTDIEQAIRCALEVDIAYGVYTIVSNSDVSYVAPGLYAELGYLPAYRFTANGLIHAKESVASEVE